MAEKDVADELDERLNGDTPDEPVEEPDLEDESVDDEDKPDDEEPGPDDVEEPEPEVVTRPAKRSARDTIQELKRERDAERQRADAAERDRAEARRVADERRTRDDARAEEQREQEILAGLDENGRTQYVLAKEVKKTQDNQSRLERQLADSRDQAAFAAKAARDPRRAQLMDEVERVFQSIPNRAADVERNAIYLLLLGKKLDEGSLKSAPARKAAAGRVAAQRATGGRPRSDAAPRARGRGDLAARMEADDPAI